MDVFDRYFAANPVHQGGEDVKMTAISSHGLDGKHMATYGDTSSDRVQGVIMPSFNDLYDFVRRNYVHSRFEGRNSAEWAHDYSQQIVQSYMADLEKYEVAYISCYESMNAQFIIFDRSLKILNADAAPVARPRNFGHLTHLLD